MQEPFGYEGEAQRLGEENAALRRQIAAAEKRVVEAEARAAAEKERRIAAESRTNDHPNTSWGQLYEDRDAWRAAFLEAATTASIEGVSLLGWYEKAHTLQQRFDTIVQLVGAPVVARSEFLPKVLSPHALRLVSVAKVIEEKERLKRQADADAAEEAGRRETALALRRAQAEALKSA